MFHARASLDGSAAGQLSLPLVLRWRFRTAGAIEGSPVTAHGLVYVGSKDHRLYALTADDGKPAWSVQLDGEVTASPCIVGSTIFAATSAGGLYALDARTGRPFWRRDLGGNVTGGVTAAPPDVQGEVRVLVGSFDNGRLFCFDAKTGRQWWSYSTDSYINGLAAVAGEMAAAGCCDGKVHLVALADGTPLRQIDGGSYIPASPALADGSVFFATQSGEVRSAALADGQLRWQRTFDNPIHSAPAVACGRVIVGLEDDASSVICLSAADGKTLWTFPAGGFVDSSPAVCGDKVIVATRGGWLFVLSLDDGRKLWQYELAAAGGPPAVADSNVFLGADDGYLYAFGPP